MAPAIIDLPHRNLLVYVTHQDSDQVDAGFQKLRERVIPKLAQDSRLRRKPYTFVYGWRGLKTILNALDGLVIPPSSPPYYHEPDPQVFRFGRQAGYRCGELLFFYPAQAAVDDIVAALLRLAEGQTDLGKLEVSLDVMDKFSRILDSTHPWLAQEMGRIAIECGRLDEAIRRLEEAERLGHQWLAVTADYLDMAPEREGGPPQGSHLPSARLEQSGGDVTLSRHVVTRTWPATKDYGFWRFPRQEHHTIHAAYEPQRLLPSRGFAEGRLDHLRYDIGWATTFSCKLACAELSDTTFQLLQEAGSDAWIYWRSYLQGRWLDRVGNLARGLAPHRLQSARDLLDELLVQISTTTRSNKRDKRYIFQGGDPRADVLWDYLEGAARELQSLTR
jgi:hypothetical protein